MLKDLFTDTESSLAALEDGLQELREEVIQQTEKPIALSIVLHHSGIKAKLFLAQFLNSGTDTNIPKEYSWVDKFLAFSAEFSGDEDSLNPAPGTYTVSEQSFNEYAPQESSQVTVVSGQTATVTFNNTLRRGDLTVTKTAEDGLVEGVTFQLYGASLSGAPVDEYAVTDRTGRAKSLSRNYR